VPVGLKRLEVKGVPVRVLDGVQQAVGPFGLFGFSDSGMLAYVPGGTSNALTLAWVDRHGVEQPVPAPPRRYTTPRLSPDGNRVAVAILEGDDNQSSSDIWIYDLVRGVLSRLTTANNNTNPVWSPDGKRLIYASVNSLENVLVSAPAVGSSAPAAYSLSKSGPRAPDSVSPDGKLVIGRAIAKPGSGNSFDVISLAVGPSNGSDIAHFLDSKFPKANAQFSPDGRWIAYDSTETGTREVYVAPYPGPGERWLVSTGGGIAPRWARSGREVFYRNGSKFMAVDIQTSPEFHAGTPKLLFETSSHDLVAYDVSPDGNRFLVLKPESTEAGRSDQVNIVVNWFRELRRRAPVGER
jgi:serine/threonine-protein kinase